VTTSLVGVSRGVLTAPSRVHSLTSAKSREKVMGKLLVCVPEAPSYLPVTYPLTKFYSCCLKSSKNTLKTSTYQPWLFDEKIPTFITSRSGSGWEIDRSEYLRALYALRGSLDDMIDECIAPFLSLSRLS
jgi:hypothetical protein